MALASIHVIAPNLICATNVDGLNGLLNQTRIFERGDLTCGVTAGSIFRTTNIFELQNWAPGKFINFGYVITNQEY